MAATKHKTRATKVGLSFIHVLNGCEGSVCKYAVWTSHRSKIAPKSHLIKFGLAHEWSGVWTGPYSEEEGHSKKIVFVSANKNGTLS